MLPMGYEFNGLMLQEMWPNRSGPENDSIDNYGQPFMEGGQVARQNVQSKEIHS